MNALENLKYEVNCAVFDAIDSVLRPRYGKRACVQDKDLRHIIPQIEQVTEDCLRRVYDNLPEALMHGGDALDKLAMALWAKPDA